jgi:hypothetical protein
MQNNTVCPSDETLMDFLEHRLDGPARMQVEQHLARCADCREQAAVCADLVMGDPEGTSLEVPPQVTRKAVDKVLAMDRQDGSVKLRDRVRRWITQGTTALDRLAWQPRPAGMAVRGTEGAISAEVIRRKKQFGDLHVVIEIENSGAGQALIRVTVVSGLMTDAPVRAALYMKNREAASSVLGQSPAVFEEIPPGIYALVFARRGIKLGEYAFEILDAP